MTTERLIEKALFWINQACTDDESVNHNTDIGRAIEALNKALRHD